VTSTVKLDDGRDWHKADIQELMPNVRFVMGTRPSGAIQTHESAGSADISPQTAFYGGTKRQILTTSYN
jgi:hypothetical protein